MTSAAHVTFTEVGPRDGFQNWPSPVPTELKVRLVKEALQAGVPRVEATSMVSPKWVPQMADAEDVLSALSTDEMSRVRVLVPNLKGFERALAAGARNVLVNVGVTDAFNQHNLNRTVKETLADIAEVSAAAEAPGVRVDASLSVSWGCPYDGEVPVSRVMQVADELCGLGCAELSFGDTIGVATPSHVRGLSEAALGRYPGVQISMHFHDTRGMGLANGMAALESGVRLFEGSVGGIGGCPFAPESTGNVCSEDLLALIADAGYETRVDVDALSATARTMSEELHAELPGRLHRAGPAPWLRH